MATSGRGAGLDLARWRDLIRQARSSRTYWVFLAAGILLVLLVVLLMLMPTLKAGMHTGLFVLQVLDSPIKPQPWFTADPLRQEISYPSPNGEGRADIYRIPDDRKRASVLIFLGANAAGRDDPDVINLGEALARAGFVVMFHWSPTMGQRQNIDPGEIENLVFAFQYLKARNFVDPNRIGMGGFSVGGSFAMVAAADPRIRDDVVFLNSFGAYYDARDLFLQVASHSTFFDGKQESWEVDPLTWQIFANELIESLDDADERELFSRHFLRGEEVSEEKLEGVSKQAQVVRRLLEGPTLEEARLLFQELPADFRQEMAYISPSEHISDIKARLLIMHDQGDLLIPVAESRRLAQAMAGHSDFRYTETEFFEHVRPGSDGDIWGLIREAFKLYRHLYSIISIATKS